LVATATGAEIGEADSTSFRLYKKYTVKIEGEQEGG
jgi:hypothetical protein